MFTVHSIVLDNCLQTLSPFIDAFIKIVSEAEYLHMYSFR